MANDSRYGGPARGLWRKVYGYSVNKPVVVSFVDTTTSTTMSIDLNKTYRHRDYFIIDGIATGPVAPAPIPVDLTEYDEGLVYMTGGDSATGNFNFTFSNNPIVVLTPDSASFWGENVNVYGFSRTSSGFTFGTSAPFSGAIRYRAIYSPTYPALCTSSYTASITASAGTATLTDSYAYTASFAALPGSAFKFLQTAWSTGTLHDVAFQTQTFDNDSATTEISAPVSTVVHFIAYYS